jgi:hypothetical protein
VPLPRVKVVTFSRNKYKSVMSTSRQTNGAHGCLMSRQKWGATIICQTFKESFLADLQTSDITPGMSKNTFEICGPLVVGRGCIWSYSSSKQLRLCQKKCYPPPSRNIEEVESNVQQAWHLSADTCMSDQYSDIHLSMRQRCVVVNRVRGGRMRY